MTSDLPAIDDSGWEAFNRDLLKAETDARIRNLSISGWDLDAGKRISDLGNLLGGFGQRAGQAVQGAGAFLGDVGQGLQRGFEAATAPTSLSVPPAPPAAPPGLPAAGPETSLPLDANGFPIGAAETTAQLQGQPPAPIPAPLPPPEPTPLLPLPWTPQEYPTTVAPTPIEPSPAPSWAGLQQAAGQVAQGVGQANTMANRFFAGDTSVFGDIVAPLAPVAEDLRRRQAEAEAINRAQAEQLGQVSQAGFTPEQQEQFYQTGAGAAAGIAQRGVQTAGAAASALRGGLARVPGAQRAYQELAEQAAAPEKLEQFVAKVADTPVPKGVDAEEWFRALRYNSMLSGPRTFMVNTISNALEVPWRLARDIPASVLRGRPEEIAPEVVGIWTGMQRGADAFMETLSKGISAEAAQRGDLPQDIASRLDPSQAGRFPGLVQAAQPVARGLEFTGRLLRGADDFAQQTAYGMVQARRAAMEASKAGLRGEAWANRVAELIEAPTTGMQREALLTSRRMTYQQDLTGFGEALQDFTRKGGVLAHIALPFLKTVWNITEAGIRRSPAGLAHTALDVARGRAHPTAAQIEAGAMPLGERLGDNVLGSLASVWFMNQALQGNISGGGPSNTRQREVLQSEGWQPYAVRIGDRWVGYGNWGPVALPLSMAAAVGESALYREPGADVASIAGDAIGNFTGLLTEQPYLQGIGGIYKAMTDPERYGSQWLNSFVGSLVPYGAAIGTVAQAIDPLERQPARASAVGIPEAVKQGVQRRIPIAREQLPVARDVFGRERPNVYAGAAAAIPLRATGATGKPIRRFLGSKGAAEDTRISQAVAEVNRWRSRPNEFPQPSPEAFRLHARFSGAENPQYTLLTQREAARERREIASRR